MKELIIYILVAISSLGGLAYSVHMLVGGLVEESTEHTLMFIVVGLGAAAIGFMFWDVMKRRRQAEKD